MNNPYIYLHEIKEKAIFAGRRTQLDTITKEISNFISGKPLRTMAIVGRKRIGKTSLLYRIDEYCRDNKIVPVMFEIKDFHIKDQWQFWYEILGQTIISCANLGILESDVASSLKFRRTCKKTEDNNTTLNLRFQEYFNNRNTDSKGFKYPPLDIIGSDIQSIINDFLFDLGYKGIIYILDEAQIVQKYPEGIDLKQAIRDLVNREIRIGLILSGLESLGTMFNEYEDPFYQRGHLVPLENFKQSDEITECILLPLSNEERELVSTMTVNYINYLSQGMPNHIQLICFAIYQRFMEKKQEDLNISIDVMDDVIELMERDASVQGDLRETINKIKALNSVDLELLFDLTRYPRWTINEVISLDESFRGEELSTKAIERRKIEIVKRKDDLVKNGLMLDDTNKFQLLGDEYVQLYLRFWYEVMKYGKLSELIVVTPSPQTPFGEKAEKLSDAIDWEIKRGNEVETKSRIRLSVFHEEVDERGEMVVERVIKRYSDFEKLKKGETLEKNEMLEMLIECLEVCKMVGNTGKHLLVCFAVRNREKPRELMHIEMYFRIDKIDEPSISWNTLGKQAEQAKIVIEGSAVTIIDLPDLNELFKDIGANYEDFMQKLELVDKWKITCIQHMLKERKEKIEKKNSDDEEEKLLDGKWLELYAKENVDEAINMLESKMILSKERANRARFHNDIGYMKAGIKGQIESAIKELNLAFDYHYSELALTLLNISYLDIINEEYEKAIKQVNDVLILTHERKEIEVGYLRSLLPKAHLPYIRNIWEHNPANVLEVSYILLAYATYRLNNDDSQKAFEVINEGLSLLPSSIWLKHTLARYHISDKRVDLALPIYRELNVQKITNEGLKWEIEKLLTTGRAVKNK